MLVGTMMISAVLGLAPSFESFLTHAEGRWNGASYTWSAEGTNGKPLGVAPGYVTTPTPSSTVMSPIIRSCGGAVQGLEEDRTCAQALAKVVLNRQVDGTTFFSYGSWAQAPVLLNPPDAEEADMLSSMNAFGLSLSLAHADRSRRRLLVVIADGELACCDVAVEGDAAAEGSTSVADTLLSGRLQCVCNAYAWEGGASSLTLDGVRPPGTASWMNARTRWSKSEASIEGGAPLIPERADDESSNCIAYLPGGAWLRVSKAWTRSDGGFESGIEVEAGSLAVEAAEVKSISHAFSADGTLSRVRFSKVVAV